MAKNQATRSSWSLLGFVVVVCVLVAAVALGSIAGLTWLLTGQAVWDFVRPDTPTEPEYGIPGAIRYGLLIAAGFGGAVGLAVAYRRQRHLEIDAAGDRDRLRLFTERFGAASAQLGGEAAVTRIAGVYALAALADEWEDQQQQCIDVLCGYLRLPYEPENQSSSSLASTTETRVWRYQDRERQVEEVRQARPGEREVRLTIISVIAAHLRGDSPMWAGRNLDFSGAVFDGGNFRGAKFSGGQVDFVGAQFSGGQVSFKGAMFTAGETSFEGAVFSAGEVSFNGATFSGESVSFFGATFSGGTVSFSKARFTAGRMSFDDAQFTAGRVSFGGATFSGGQVSFDAAEFIGGTVNFGFARFTGGTVHFGYAEFIGGTVQFGYAEFIGGTVQFGGARFTAGRVSFNSARFTTGQVSFEDAKFDGGQVSFKAADCGGELTFVWPDNSTHREPPGTNPSPTAP